MKISNFLIIKFIFVFAFGISISAAGIQAAPPANDNLANAEILSGAAGSVTGTVVEATTQQGEFSHAGSNDGSVYRTVWFEWTATESKPVVLEVTTNAFDAAMAVYSGANFPLSSLSYNNDTFGTRPRIEFMAVSGTSYKIVVGIYNNSTAAGDNFTLAWQQNNVPTNDNFADALTLENSSGSVAATNLNATSVLQEPVFGSGKSVWFNFTNTTGKDFSATFSTLSSRSPFFDSTLAVFSGSVFNQLTTVVMNNNVSATAKSRVTFLAKAGVTYRIAVDSQTASDADNIVLSWDITKVRYSTDFATKIGNNGEILYDDAADLTVFRPADGVWYHLDSANSAFRAFQFGANGDTPVAADYDGDGRSDYAVARNTGGLKIWYIRNSFDETYRVAQWGLSDDKPVPGDFDADGRMDIAVFRPSTNVWYILRSSDNQVSIKEFGLSGDIPVLGDFKGTGAGTDIAVFRPSNGTWYIFDGVNTIFAPFGLSGDKPVPSDYDHDGKTDLAVFRPSNGTWYYIKSRTNQQAFVKWGQADDIPMIGDYDNNSNDLDDFAVFRPGDSTWYVLKSEGFVVQYRQFGASGDIPASSLANLMQ